MSEDRPSDATSIRSARIQTRHDEPDLVRAALAPDNTDSMDATVDRDGRIVCAIERGTTGGLQSTVDDYLVNLRVADRVIDDAADAGNRGDAVPATDRDDPGYADDRDDLGYADDRDGTESTDTTRPTDTTHNTDI